MARESWAAILRDSDHANWSLNEVTARLVDLDFDRPFFPEPLVHSQRLPFLTTRERLLLNQIRAHSYLGLAVIGEKFVLPFVMSRAAQRLYGEVEPFLALMGFGHQAAKHIALFRRFASAFERGFDVVCDIIGPVEDITARFLMNDTLTVSLLVLHLESITQTHYVRGARVDQEMDEQFKQLLHLHWRDEAQNARLDGLILAELAAEASQHERERAIEQYILMLSELSAALRGQVELDLAAFERAARPLTDDERAVWRQEQGASYEEIYIRHGLEHRLVRQAIAEHFGGPLPMVDDAANQFGLGARSS